MGALGAAPLGVALPALAVVAELFGALAVGADARLLAIAVDAVGAGAVATLVVGPVVALVASLVAFVALPGAGDFAAAGIDARTLARLSLAVVTLRLLAARRIAAGRARWLR